VGKVVQPLYSVNYHDSRTHGQERHGPLTRLVGLWWFGSGWLTRSRWFGSWYTAGGKPVGIVLGLAIGKMHVRSVGLVPGVTPMSLWPSVTVGQPRCRVMLICC
jgi:hypothetical protein